MRSIGPLLSPLVALGDLAEGLPSAAGTRFWPYWRWSLAQDQTPSGNQFEACPTQELKWRLALPFRLGLRLDP